MIASLTEKAVGLAKRGFMILLGGYNEKMVRFFLRLLPDYAWFGSRKQFRIMHKASFS